MSDRVRTGLLSLVLAAVLVVVAGCGGSSFVGRHYDNFTAYYNTFYNARTVFDEGVKALQQNDDAVDRRYYIDVFVAPGRASSSENFQNAIDKSADVLRDHPDSKWVDDALLLIGKSYFYQHNFVGAEQKFREVVEIGSVLEDESRLWLARTLIAAGAYNEARDHLVASLSQEDLSERWKPRIHLALGELYVNQERFEEAAEQLELGLEEVRDNDLEARGWLLLGQVLETLERYEDAVAAYERVSRAHPRYELSYAANVSAVRVRGLYLDADQALRDLRRMQRDDKNFSNRFELAYLQGLIYQAEGRTDDARDQYRDVLYDSDGQIGDLRGRIHYALGELYSNAHEDYLLASAHYDTAKTALSSGGQADRVEEQFAPEAVTDADRKAEVFATFAEVRRDVARMDSLLELGSLPDEEFAERILEIRRARAEELSEQQRLVAQRQAERGFQDAAARSAAADSRSANQATGEAGFLFHRDPVRVQESRMSFLTRWGERPRVPNWRRSEAITAASANRETPDGATATRMLDNSAGVGQNPLPEVDYSDVPRDSLSRARMNALRALARYELGNVLFLAMERPDSAAAWYRMVIEQDPGENVAQRAYYALAEVQRSLGDTAAANTIYQQVLRDYPESDFAGRVREQLGLRNDVPSDSLSIAFEEYERAFQRWRQGQHSIALNEMVTVAANHHGTEAGPKALLAAGRIFLEWAEKDSLDIFAPLPLNVDESVLETAGLRSNPTNPSSGSEAGSATTSKGVESATASKEDESPTVSKEEAIAEARGAASGGNASVPRETVAETDIDALKAAERRAAERGSTAPRRRIEDANGTDTNSDDIPPLKPREDALPNEDAVPNADAVPTEDTMPAEAAVPAEDAVPTDETGFADSTAAPDSLVLDVGLVPNGEDAVADEPPAPEDEGVYLTTLYNSIKSQYPATVYADQADEMLRALETHRAEVFGDPSDTLDALAEQAAEDSAVIHPDSAAAQTPLDSLATAVADSIRPAASDTVLSAAEPKADESLRADSAAAQPEQLASADTSVALPADSSARAAVARPDTSTADAVTQADTSRTIPTGEESLRSSDGIDVDLGGFTIVLGMNVQKAPIEALAQEYADKGFRTAVIQDKVGSTTLYRAAIGHFASPSQARRALVQHGEELGQGAQVAPLASPQ